ncbi:MAG: RNA pseudouridine synthase, partial [Clostridia bacterium]|nr:RNA pseudouridine synthase [Clostridia bacterium]
NQIRVQLKSLGHAVIGDEKYGSEKNPLGRLGLHATRLEFIHPITKEVVSIACAPPANFRNLF